MSTQISVGSSYITVPNTSVQFARNLLQRFCSCPSAKSLLNRIASSTNILLETDNFYSASATKTNNGVTISIPRQGALGQTDEIMFLFELLNAKNMKKFDDIHDRASLGDLNIEDYSTEIETIEAESSLGRSAYKAQCAKNWNIRNTLPPTLSIDAAMTTPEAILWKSNWMCHTDHYREEWIDQYRDTYCRKHPTDTASCKVKKANLCSYSTLQNMPAHKKSNVLAKRLCDGFFATAPNHVKPALIPIIQKTCPEVESSSDVVAASIFVATIGTMVGVLCCLKNIAQGMFRRR